MRILITSGIFPPEVGGPATFGAEFGRRLATMGHDIKVITYSDKPSYDQDKDFPYPIVRIVRKNKVSNYIRYFIAVYRECIHYDFIFSLDWFSAGVPVLTASFLRRKKYFLRIGGGYIWEKYLAEGNPPMTLQKFYEKDLYKDYKILFFLIKRVLRNARVVAFNSKIQKRLYQRYYRLSQKKTQTIFNPMPYNRLSNLVQTYKSDFRHYDKEIVFAGRFIKMKNVDSLIKAFALLKDKEYKLLLIGDGPTKEELMTLVKQFDIGNRVSFMPAMKAADLYRRISSCAYIVLPSWTDVAPNQIYECIALNIPYLLTKETYIDLDMSNSITIDPSSVADIAAKMNALLDPEYHKNFTDACRKNVIVHTWDEVIRDYLNIFRS